jgi:DNA-binding Xre family transcriptional regulator
MVALGFKFTYPSRAIGYWLLLLKQEHDIKGWSMRDVVQACENLCQELETRGLEAGVENRAVHKATVGAGARHPSPEPERSAKVGRLSSSINSPLAARRMESYLAQGVGQTDLATRAGTTDRTLRKFRKTGKIRRDLLDGIAKAMGTTMESLLKSE